MSATGTNDPALLEIDDLQVEFSTHDGIVHAVNGVSLSVRRGETLAVVGESGSGKSVSALSVMGLIDKPGRIAGGDIVFEGTSLRGLSEREYRRLRGGDLAMIFQDPLSSLNPAFRVGDQIAEALLQHTYDKKDAARRQAAHLLEIVGIPQAGERARDYPHQFSGGMRQRAMIAMAIANKPKLLIADEPTPPLDVTSSRRRRHHHPIRDARDDAEVVGDEEHRGVGLLLRRAEHVEHLRLDRHVERRRGLVGDQQLRLVRDGHRDHRPLPHAAGELVGIVTGALPCLRDADDLQQVRGLSPRRVLLVVGVLQQRLGDLVPDAERRVQ